MKHVKSDGRMVYDRDFTSLEVLVGLVVVAWTINWTIVVVVGGSEER